MAELKSVLRQQDLRLTKRLGQHHLVNSHLIERILKHITVLPHEPIVEIGAGLGALTEPLAQRSTQVIAVEIDRRICEGLRARMVSLPQVSVVCQDILEFAWDHLKTPVVVVGAIPYSITSSVIVSLCEHRHQIREAVLILQREVAQRLVASPGTKAYGRLSVLAQYGWELTMLFPVPRRAFFPQPTVESACLRLVSRPQPLVAVADENFFFQVVKAAFSQRRKSLINCLRSLKVPASARPTLETFLTRELGLPPQVRGESLSLAHFAALTHFLQVALSKNKVALP